MNLGDFQEIEPIYNLEFDDFWKPQNLKSELQNVSSKYIVAKENGEIVGFAGICIQLMMHILQILWFEKAIETKVLEAFCLKNL